MQIHSTHIDGCFYTQPTQYHDNRGIFSEIYKDSIFKDCKQMNYSFSKKGTIRGIHRTPYAKFVTCVYGNIYDVCVDLRQDSKTYLDHYGTLLDSIMLNSLYIPPYCGHGFLAIADSIVIYLQTDTYNKEYDETFCYKSYNIDWPNLGIENIISNKDKSICNQEEV